MSIALYKCDKVKYIAVMQVRAAINSQSLKQRFPKVYQEFFSKCQIIASAPVFFLWAGEYIGYHGGLTLGQKIPLRVYVGIESNSQKLQSRQKLQITAQGSSFSFQDSQFQEDRFEELARVRLTNFLNSYFEKQKESLTIHFLSEVPFESLSSIGAMATALAVCLSLKFSLLAPAEIEKWKEISSSSLIQKQSLKFDPLFRLAWKISVAYRDGRSSGLSVFNSLLPTKYPTAYCLERKKQGHMPANIGSKYELIDKTNYWGGRLKEIFKIDREPSWPIDFGIIMLGQPRATVPWSISEIKESIRSVSKFIKAHLDNFQGSQGAHIKPLLCQNKKNINPKDPWETCLEIMDFLNFKLFTDIGHLLKNGHQEPFLKSSLNTINKLSLFCALLGVIPPHIENIFSIIQEKAKRVELLGAGVKMNSAIRKGEILFVAPQPSFRQLTDSVLSLAQKETPEITASLAYASWLDGFEEQGAKVEQYLEKRIYSDFISPGSIFVCEYVMGSEPANFILAPEQFNKEQIKVDLLLNKPEGKIYIKGKPLCSKDIHSAKTTIRTLTNLLEAEGREVSNRTLPCSAYADSRYEFQGKIAIPLKKVLEKKLGEKLNLQVRGGITDFVIKFEPDNLRIWVVEKWA